MNKVINAVKFFDENGEQLSMLAFPDTMVENWNDKVIVIQNMINEKLQILPKVKDPTLKIVECPQFLKPKGTARIKLRYKPTMDNLKAVDSLIEFAFRVI